MNLSGRPLHRVQFDDLRLDRPADATEAVAQIREIIAAETARLTALKRDHLDPIDRLDRASARERAMIGVDKESVLLRRYETAVEREFHRSIADLMRLRKDARPVPRPDTDTSPVRNEPVAEPGADEPVTSNGLVSPRPGSFASGSSARLDSWATLWSPISGVETARATDP